MGDTKIQWTNKTWNPIRARNIATDERGWYCEKVTEGCRNCYAEKMNLNTYFGNGLPYKAASLPQVELFLDEKILQQPLHWRKPQNVFPCSMTDLFGRFVPSAWIDQIFAVMALAPQHSFQITTKRPERALEEITRLGRNIAPLEAVARALGHTFDFNGISLLPWPIPNIWLGVSVEDQKNADERIPLLLETPAAVRWVSAEPLLGPIDFQVPWSAYNAEYPAIGIHWVVVGGESGKGARQCDSEWIESIVYQCKNANVPVFVKQLGSRAVYRVDSEMGRQLSAIERPLRDSKGGDITEFPDWLKVREFPVAEHAR